MKPPDTLFGKRGGSPVARRLDPKHFPQHLSSAQRRYIERYGTPLNEVVKASLLAYNDLYYGRRDHVLEHLYCVIGNGYDWQNGRLVMRGLQTDAKMQEAIRRVKAGETRIVPDRFAPSLTRQRRAYRKGMSPELRKRLAQIDKEVSAKMRAEDRKRRKAPIEKVYPLCEYSAMATVPDNAKPDYVRGAFEAIEIVLATDPNYIDPHYDPKGERQRANIAFAQKCKDDLCKRFPDVAERFYRYR